MRLIAVVAISSLLVAAPARAAWRPPVGGPVTRGFDVGPDPFAAGRHRGADLGAAPGSVVHAPCGGEVVVAGRVGSSGRLVTVLCRPWRVTLMPLATVLVGRGTVVGRGARVGTVAGSPAHAGLHLGVRRDGARFGYVNPLRFLAPSRPAPPLVGPRGPSVRRPPAPAVTPAPPPRRVAAPAVAVAPWPAWAGLALVLGGAGVRWAGVRRRRGLRRRRTSTAAG
jgi:peptidase M23-like protein